MSSLFTPPIRGGVYHVAGTDVERRLRTAGWNAQSFDAATPRDLVSGFGKLPGFPDYYGRNLDALDEVLRTLMEPVAVVWRDWRDGVLADPDYWQMLREVVTGSAQNRTTRFAVVLPGPMVT